MLSSPHAARLARRIQCGLLALLALATGCAQNDKPLPDRPVLPAEKAGSDAAAGRVRLRDVAQGAGLDYRWTIPGRRPFNLLQTIGNGCACLDYNNDNNVDILLVGSRLA